MSKKYKNGKLSARWYYDNGGKIGDIVDYSEDKTGELRELKMRANGSPYFAKVDGNPKPGKVKQHKPKAKSKDKKSNLLQIIKNIIPKKNKVIHVSNGLYKKGKLSARWYYDHGGKVGDIVDYTEDRSGELRELKLRVNGSPYFAKISSNKTKPIKVVKNKPAKVVKNKPTKAGKCSDEKKQKCKSQGKMCNPLSGRCKALPKTNAKAKSVNKPQKPFKKVIKAVAKVFHNSPVKNNQHSFSPVKHIDIAKSKFDKIEAMRYNELRPRQIEVNPSILNKYQGWFASVKIDGWQGIWDGVDTLYTRSYKKSFNVPDWWLSLLQRSGVPAMAGEIIRKNSKNSADQATLASKSGTAAWGTPQNPLAFFHVFDVISVKLRNLPFEKRLPHISRAVKKACGNEPKCPIKMASQVRIKSASQVYNLWKKVLSSGGEGLVLTSPDSKYGNLKTRKSNERVKLKGRNDDEGIVVGYKLGYSANPTWLKSLVLNYKNKIFNVGIGLKMTDRQHYSKLFPKGTIVTFSYRLLSKSGTPLEPRLVGKRSKSTLPSSHWINN